MDTSSSPPFSSSSLETIFVGIPSYRDPELCATVSSLLSNAQHASRVHICVVEQCFSDESRAALPESVKVKFLEASFATGPCLARHELSKLYDNETYALLLDSHMRMISNWDTILIEMLQICQREHNCAKPILTTYPAPYTLDEHTNVAKISEEIRPPFLVFSGFGAADGMMRFKGKLLSAPRANCTPCFFWVSGFSFSHGRMMREVVYDADLPFLFFGEETLMTARLWTSGYDFFCPGRNITYHLWERVHRPNFRRDTKEDHKALELQSLEKVRNILKGELPGLGKDRSIDAFWEFCGVDFWRKTFTPKAALGGLKEADFYDPEAMMNSAMALIMGRLGKGK